MGGEGSALTSFRIARCRLRAVPGEWALAVEKASEIDAHWRAAQAREPSLFDGAVHLMTQASFAEDGMEGDLIRADFKSYLYWCAHGFEAAGVRDAFGSALIRSAEGHLVLAEQGRGINAGRVYPPSGFIDARDVAADGTVDIEASIARELEEETGLSADEFERTAGFVVASAGPCLSLAMELRSPLPARALCDRIRDFLAAQANPELARLHVVRSLEESRALALPPYARALVAEVFREA